MADSKGKDRALKAQVLRRCREELEALGVDVDRSLAAVESLALGEATSEEKEARELYHELQRVLRRGARLAAKTKAATSGFAGRFRSPALVWWQTLTFAPDQPWKEDDVRTSRARIARLLSQVNVLARVPPPTARVVALHSLLLGNWPESLPSTAKVNEVINAEAHTVRRALAEASRRIADKAG